MKTTSAIDGFASFATPRAVLCLLVCWLCLGMNAVAGPPPVITVQPADQSVQAGGSASFVVQATSGTTIRYQWYFQASAIPGATNNIYTRTNAQPANAGAYYASVANADGTVNSSNAILSVVPYPVISINSISSGQTPGATSLTWSHPVNNGTNRVLLVGLAIDGLGAPVSAITYGGVALTQVGRATGNHAVEIWRLVNPAVGTNNIVVNFVGTTPATGGATTFNNVNQTTPTGTFVGAEGTSTTPSVTVPSAAEELVLDTLYAVTGPTATPGAGQIAQYNLATGSGPGTLRGAGSTEAGDASVPMSWTLGASVQWQIAGVSIKPAPDTNAYLSGYWTLDANANDSSGNNYHGILTNGAVIDTNSATRNIGPGKLSLDGVNDYVDLSAHRGTFAKFSKGTISAWIKTTDNQATIFDVSDLAVANGYASLWLYQGALAFSVVDNPQVQLDVATAATVNDNVWHHVAVTVDATGNKLYIDGVQQTSLTYYKGNASTQKFFNSVPGIDFMAIGTDRNSSGLRDLFPGLIDDVRVYYGALTAADIANLVALRGADVATTMTGPTSVLATSNFTYTISVTNLGYTTASNVVVSDTLPAGVNVVGVSGGGIVTGGGLGQVVSDNSSSNHTSGTLNWSHTTTAATNRLMLVGVSIGGSGAVSNITYGGVNLAKVLAQTNGTVSSELWQLVNPPSGSNTIAMTKVGNPPMLFAGAATFSGVDPIMPLSDVTSATGSSKLTAVTVNSATNEYVFDIVTSAKDGKPNFDNSQTELWTGNANPTGGGSSLKPGAYSVTMLSDVKDGLWVDIGASVKAAGLVGTVNWTIPKLASGAATNFTITVTAPLTGTLSNTVASTATTSDPNPANNDGSAASSRVVTTVTPVAEIVTTQSGLVSVPPLTNYSYTVTVSNQGPNTASSVVVSDTLDPRLTYVSASDGGSYLAGQVTWPALTSLRRGVTTNFTVTVRSPISGSLTNRASSTSVTTDLNPGNNNGSASAAQVVTTVTPLQVANTSFGANVQTLNWSHTISPGSSRILVVGVSINSTNATVNAATFNNLLPLTLIGQTNGTHTKVLMYRLLNPPVGTYSVSINLNTAVGVVGGAVSMNGVNQTTPISAFAGSSGTGSNTSVAVVSVAGGVVIDAVAPKSSQPAGVYSPGVAQTEQWNLSATNYSGAGSSSYGAATVTSSWTLDSPVPWAMAAVALNPATVLADVTLSATGPASVSATSNLTCSITVTNLGGAAASNLVVCDVLPAGTIFVSASSGGVNNGGVITWPVLSNFANGARTNYTFTITAPSIGILTNIAYCTSLTADPDPSNNNGTAANNQVITSVIPSADVVATVTGPASAFVATDFSYTVTVTNAGPSPADTVVVSDALPAGTTFVSASGGGVNGADLVTWSLASLASGATTNFTVTVIAPASSILTNTVASSSATADPFPSNNAGTATGAWVVTVVYGAPSMTGQWLARGAFQMELATVPGVNCSIEASTNLLDWQVLVTTNSGSGSVHFVDEDTANYPMRFYRSRFEP